MTMKTALRLITLALLTSSAFFISSALACTTTAWTSAAAGTLADDPTNGVPRVSGLCGLEATATGHVVDNSPAAEAVFIARFYVLVRDLTAGTHTVFTAYSDEVGTKLFEITYDGTNFTLDATAATGTASAGVAADTTHWNLLEVRWESGQPGSLWVNTDAASVPADATFSSGAGAVEQVRLGTEAGVGGTAYFDDYESHRSLAVGPSGVCDANADTAVDINDILAVVDESFNAILASGAPDCNLDSSVNINDVLALVDIIF